MSWSSLFALAVAFAAVISQSGPSEPLQQIRLRPQDRWPDCRSAEPIHLRGGELIDELNRVVQTRFASFDEFGMRRISTPDQHKTYRPVFTPETDGEFELACTLQGSGGDAAILVAGRGLLGYEAGSTPEPLSDLGNAATLSAPVRVTGAYKDGELPDRAVLKRVAEAAFRRGKAEEDDNGWAVRGYVVVATSEACVKCHNGELDRRVPQPVLFPTAPRLVVGDPIGVLVWTTR